MPNLHHNAIKVTTMSGPICSPNPPRVSVGLAVFNGENMVADALRSILEQSLTDFELIISDNGSTDNTESICREFAARDPRIRYIRHSKNRGASWNQNFVINAARAPYFKLAAHDDTIKPGFLETCVETLDSHPDAVCAYTRAMLYTQRTFGSGWVIQKYQTRIRGDSDEAHIRFRDLIARQYWVTPIHGVIRLEALKKTHLFGDFHSADVALLIRLGMLGKMIEAPDYLFVRRFHPAQSIRLLDGDKQDYYDWWNPSKKRRVDFPTWRFLREQGAAIVAGNTGFIEKLKCVRELTNWIAQKRRELILELVPTVFAKKAANSET